MVEQETPQLPAYDHEAIAIAEHYNEQELYTVVADFLRSRGRDARVLLRADRRAMGTSGHPSRSQ